MTDRSSDDPVLTILLVDDEPPVIKIVGRMLTPLGCEILTATSGFEALEIYAALHRPIDLLLTDLHMPKMSGRALAAQLRTLQPGLKVLYLTGRCDELFGALTELETHEAFIEKPVTPAAICEAVSMHLYGTLSPPGAAKPKSAAGHVGITRA
jgi:two-component system, cell cycle sensor histidine kinase and response regulator CckA